MVSAVLLLVELGGIASVDLFLGIGQSATGVPSLEPFFH